MAKVKAKYYAYVLLSNRATGVVSSWRECEQLVKGKEARYRGFTTESAALAWLKEGARYEGKEKKAKPILKSGIYFDAGTGRGKGVEVKVTDEKGRSLLGEVLNKKEITEFDTHRVTISKATNNYGELLGCYLALKIALEKGVMHIFGDSRLVVDYWSKGFMKKDKIAPETRVLMQKVRLLREGFEKKGGVVSHISGDHNPADLGFHR